MLSMIFNSSYCFPPKWQQEYELVQFYSNIAYALYKLMNASMSSLQNIYLLLPNSCVTRLHRFVFISGSSHLLSC